MKRNTIQIGKSAKNDLKDDIAKDLGVRRSREDPMQDQVPMSKLYIEECESDSYDCSSDSDDCDDYHDSSEEEDHIEVQKRNGRILKQIDTQLLLNKKKSAKKHWTACFGDRIYTKL